MPKITKEQLEFSSVVGWSNGGDPDDYGWVINGTKYSASDLMNDPGGFPGNLAEVASAEGYGADGALFLQDHPELED
jgi:hypothetical protein